MSNSEWRSRLRFHHDGASGAHQAFHKAAENAKAALDIYVTLPRTFRRIVATGRAVALYHDSLDKILETSDDIAHPEEEKEFKRIKKVIEEANRMGKANLN